MKNLRCYLWIAILLYVTITLAACGGATPTPAPSEPPSVAGACGDGVCDGPENAQNCPQDCQASQTSPPGDSCGDGVCDGPEDAQNCPQDCQTEEPMVGGSEACQNPNPRRAVISEELLDWQDWLVDGGFEQGSAEVVLADFPQGNLKRGTGERSQQAAHTGSWGYAITTGTDEGLVFSVKFYMEKGEDTRFTFWARSVNGSASLKPIVQGVDFSDLDNPTRVYVSERDYSIGTEWTQVSFETDFAQGFNYASFDLAIPSNTTLYLDDITIEFPVWKMATYSDPHTTVGGIPVPNDPVAPVHINFLIHIEDPSILQTNEIYFQQKTAVFRELARIFHEHGGSLTIQPEEDWVMASDRFAPGLLQELAEGFNVVYSTHTHGPHCRDDQGRLRSHSDCNANQDTPGWDHSITDREYPYVVEYVRNLHDLITEASGVSVTDHNGNWEFDQAGRLSEIPMITWSAYKNHTNQETYDVLINNPWRPTEASPDENIEVFLTHDPDTQIIYIPGWGQAITRHPERILDRIPPILSQFIYYADPERVNTFYVVMHVDHFYSRTGDPNYIAYDPATGKTTFADEFKQHMAYWDDLLTDVIDPLVQQGYLQWTSLPEIGELYQQWEADCEAIAATAPSPAGTSSPPVGGESDDEPPINISLILHIDPQVDHTTETFKVTPEIYQLTHDEIDWLMEEASRHDLHFTALYNGWYPKWALEHDDLIQFEELLARGHEIGSHAHRLTYDEEQDLWIAHVNELSKYGRPNYDPELTHQAWDDAYRYVDALLSEIGVTNQNQAICAVPFKCSDEGLLMTEFGFTIAPGGRSEKSTSYFGHLAWNPWRPAANDEFGHELEEDLSANFLYLDHLAQIGIAGGAHGIDLSVPQLQRRFLMLYNEWLSRERTGSEDRVWTFGFVYHPNYGDRYNAELVEFLSWLDTSFVGKMSPQGNLIARYATVGDIAQQYYAWESAHPGVSSFNYVIDDPYPYTYAILPEKLEDAAYEEKLNLGSGVTCYRLSKDGKPIYLMWSDSGTKTVDFSSQLNGQVHLTNAEGKTSTQDASALQLTEEPLIVEP